MHKCFVTAGAVPFLAVLAYINLAFHMLFHIFVLGDYEQPARVALGVNAPAAHHHAHHSPREECADAGFGEVPGECGHSTPHEDEQEDCLMLVLNKYQGQPGVSAPAIAAELEMLTSMAPVFEVPYYDLFHTTGHSRAPPV